MNVRSKFVLLGLVCLLAVNSTGCQSVVWRSKFYLPPIAKIERNAPFVKCHTGDGHVIVLSDWEIDHRSGLIAGTGIRYDEARTVVERGEISIPYRRVLVIEASQPEVFFNGYRELSMGILTGLSLLLTILIVG